MADTNLNLTEIFPLSDELTKSELPNRYSVDVVSNLALSETITEIHKLQSLDVEESLSVNDVFNKSNTERYSRNIEDGLAVGDVIGTVYQYNPIFNLEDTVNLGEEFGESHNSRVVLPQSDIMGLSDDVVISVTDRFDLDFGEFLGLTDFYVIKGTNRIEVPIPEVVSLIEEFLQEFGIKVINGTVDGESFKSFPTNASAALVAIPPFNWIFVRWQWEGGFKTGIQNLYDSSTTLTVPSGGGEIIANFFNPGTIDPDSQSLVFILDLFDFEYIEDPDGDYILTKETLTSAGDSMGVAKTSLTIEQGSSFLRIVIYRDSNGDPVDLTGYTAEMQVRKTKESDTIILTLNTSNGYLILGGTAGTITISTPANITDALDFVWGRYDLELYPGGDTTQAVRLLEGKINLSKQVTQ